MEINDNLKYRILIEFSWVDSITIEDDKIIVEISYKMSDEEKNSDDCVDEAKNIGELIVEKFPYLKISDYFCHRNKYAIVELELKDMKKYKLPTQYDKLSIPEKGEVRKQYIREQNNKCYYCGEDINLDPPTYITDKKINWDLFPPNFLKHPIHLQHNHYTGMTEGAVHAYCNAVMWQYEGR